MSYRYHRIFWLVLVFLLGSGSTSTLHAQNATVRESKEVFRTYPFNDPDPVPKMTNIYPYFRFEGFSLKGEDRQWKIITMENPYIKLKIAPEMGGKVLGAFVKSSGKPFIYFNKVIKFREIAMRGPWTSGGLEFNFGDIGHTPTTATPVDYLTRTNDDGSVSCIIGALDLPSQTEWTVEIRLPKDKAYFETHSSWFNPTDLNTSMYHWQCAAIDGDTDLQLEFPGTHYIGHGGEFQSWPIDTNGRGISFYANNNFGSAKSYHVLGEYTSYFGARFMNEDVGVVHFSEYGDKPGKKIWIWGLSRQGEIWKDILTDPELGNKQYVEIQSGFLFNQAASSSGRTPFKHMFFPPLSGEYFAEAWFPYMNIGGIVEANLSGALNVEEKDGIIKVGFCPLQTINEELVATINGKEVFKKKLSLRPLQSSVVSFEHKAEGPVRVSVGKLISFDAADLEAKKLHRPLSANTDFDWDSVFGLYTDGIEQARQRNYHGALEKLQACLQKEPTYTPALTAMAETYYRRMEYEKALDFATRALANDTYDPDANFIYAVINRRLGRLYDARDGFDIAARSMNYRSAANLELAEVSFLQHRYGEAKEYLSRAREYDPHNPKTSYLEMIVLRKEHDKLAENVVKGFMKLHPLDHYAQFENYFLNSFTNKSAVLKNLTSTIVNELPHETYLEVASYYMSLGLNEEASHVLSIAPSHPMVDLWSAHLCEQSGKTDESASHLDKAVQASPNLVLPFRVEDGEILRWAVKKSDDWKLKYYLALVYWSRDRMDLARQLFESCGDIPSYGPFYIARGNFLKFDSPEDAFKNYQRALQVDSSEWRAYQVISDYYNEHGRHPEALDVLQRAVAKFPDRYTFRFNLARTLLFNRRYEESAAILDTITILPFEGARYGREVYRQAFVLLAATAMNQGNYQKAIPLLEKAKLWPERLGVGKPYEVDDRLEDFLEGGCYQQSGDKHLADAFYQKVVDYTNTHKIEWGANSLVAAMALQNMGKDSTAKELMESWGHRNANDIMSKWSSFIFDFDLGKANEIAQQLRGSSGTSLLSLNTIDSNFALVVELADIFQGFTVKPRPK